MKKSIHPTFHTDTKVMCVCGNTFATASTMAEIKVEICSRCHPFYTGQVKYVDTMGRVEKFQKRQKDAQKTQAVLQAKKKEKLDQRKQQSGTPKTLREMLLGK
jgi:large subunit ribosomal protein L31